MWIKYNPNPLGRNVDDCTVRAICKLTGKTWEEVYIGIVLQGLLLANMPNGNDVWGAYLKRLGYKRRIVPDTCPDCYTVKDFCRDHPRGRYLLALSSHVVTVEDGSYFDTFDSGAETPIYYWTKESEKNGI